jgi:hypothetical protein
MFLYPSSFPAHLRGAYMDLQCRGSGSYAARGCDNVGFLGAVYLRLAPGREGGLVGTGYYVQGEACRAV